LDTVVPTFFRDRGLQLLLFGGKGGVGKTSCATATAVRLANDSPQCRFLLVSTDPAHSLADSMAGTLPPHNLAVLELDAQQYLDVFRQDHHTTLREIARRGTFLDDEDISRFLDLSLPGLDELMAFFEISRWVEGGGYHCIVVDTAPTGHTLRLLSMPELIRKWLEALDALLAKDRYMKRLFSGSYKPNELDEFLLNLSASAQRMKDLLGDSSRCCFVPIMLPEALSIRETLTMLEELERLKVPATDILVNKLFPDGTCPVCAAGRARQMRELGHLPSEFSKFHLWGIPLYPEEVRGPGPLKTFWQEVSPLSVQASGLSPVTSLQSSPRVERPANPPSEEARLLLFAGKGGVGKTTLACATAIHLARLFPDREVFLFSTDPAHSLSNCLDTPIGPEPKKVAQGLTAMEIDPQAEFEHLKGEYAEELGKFLTTASPHFDLTFDREVMERVMDLSPPGLDEVMALTLVMEFMARDSYDFFILDSAPTGHLIRLLELPHIIDQWLKVFFGLFLKYRQVFCLPRISRRLVQISKALKHLQGLLIDPKRASLYAVAILTEMAFEETKDLAAACERMNVAVPAVFLNMVAPESECPLCPVLCRRESLVKDEFRQAFPRQHQVTVYRWDDPRGLERLGKLGEALYQGRGIVSPTMTQRTYN
jgi:arsenite-transporting ATPase